MAHPAPTPDSHCSPDVLPIETCDVRTLEATLNHVRAVVGSPSRAVEREQVTNGRGLPERSLSRFVWALAKVSVASLTCGSVLMVGSAVASRRDLLPTGIATAVLGAIGLLTAWCFRAMRATSGQ